MPPAGWYPDGAGKVRWWDGEAWTNHEVPSPQPGTATPDDNSQIAQACAIDRIDSLVLEGEGVSRNLGFVVDLVVLVGASGAAAVISPEVESAAGGGWFAVFFATLTLSLSVAFIVFLMVSQRMDGAALIPVAVLALFVSNAVAFALGAGYLDLSGLAGGAPAVVLLQAAGVAMQTYGVLGAILGAAVGSWIGYRLGNAFPASAG
jgi:hypothetical protein